jgi:cytoskeletal protein CcmA (bactofilin family)
MFGKKTTADNKTPVVSKKNSTPSVISQDMHVLGNIISEGFIDIDGHIDGNVKCESVIVRENGSILGDLVAGTLQIYGSVEGLVKGRSVNLFPTAKVTGTIMYENLSVEDGAIVDGKFKRTTKVFSDDAPEDEPEIDDKEERPRESIMENLRLISE